MNLLQKILLHNHSMHIVTQKYDKIHLNKTFCGFIKSINSISEISPRERYTSTPYF